MREAIEAFLEKRGPAVRVGAIMLGALLAAFPVLQSLSFPTIGILGGSLYALCRDPTDAAASYNRGNAWARKDELDKAIADYTQALRLKPDFAAAYYNIACLEAKQGRAGVALEHLAQAIRRDETYREKARSDPAFASLRQDARFQALIGEP